MAAEIARLQVQTKKSRYDFGAAMPHENTVLHDVLKELPRRQFAELVERFGADRGVRRLSCRGQLVAMLYAQLSGAASLRDLEARLVAQRARLYHLGCAPVRRSTLADANAKRSLLPFQGLAELLLARCGQALGRRDRAEAAALIRILDSTLVKLGAQRSSWAQCWRPGFAAAKLHLAWASRDHLPVRWAVTPAAESDVGTAKAWPIEPGAIYIFDRGYCDYAWWAELDRASAVFVAGTVGISCAGHDDGKEGPLAWHAANRRSSLTSCWTSSLPAATPSAKTGSSTS
jgi:hypothetical protein